MHRLSYFLIVLGLLVLIFPKGNQFYQDYKQIRLLDEQSVHSQYSQLNEIFIRESELAEDVPEEELIEEPLEEVVETPSTQEEQKVAATLARPKPIATIKISKINVNLPILPGATEANLKYAATHITETSPIGEIGNAGIAAHRARAYGRLFNRLDELEIGDEISIIKDNQEYIYTVFNISLVDPSDVSVLNRNNTHRIITLITCDPVINPTHRLIVHAKM